MARIGVLALQGGFDRHAEMLGRLGAPPVEVRRAKHLEGLSGLVLPGGESSTMLKLLSEEDLADPIRAFHRDGGALFGTCAGAILLASGVTGPEQDSLALMDFDVVRNGYGRQRDSSLASAPCPELGEPDLPLVLIRAPVIARTGPAVRVLLEHRGRPVLVEEGRALASTFHPELTEDPRVHSRFLALAGAGELPGGSGV